MADTWHLRKVRPAPALEVGRKLVDPKETEVVSL